MLYFVGSLSLPAAGRPQGLAKGLRLGSVSHYSGRNVAHRSLRFRSKLNDPLLLLLQESTIENLRFTYSPLISSVSKDRINAFLTASGAVAPLDFRMAWPIRKPNTFFFPFLYS